MAAKENKILPFATNIESNDILTDEEYETDVTRTGGNIIGIAKRRPNNKALKQATLLASALAQLIANGSKEDGSADDGYDVDDSITFEQMEANLRNVLVGIIEDTAGSDNTLVHIANNETITGTKTFSKKIIANGGVQLPSNAPAGDNDAATKQYVDQQIPDVSVYVKTVNNVAPDDNGNVNIDVDTDNLAKLNTQNIFTKTQNITNASPATRLNNSDVTKGTAPTETKYWAYSNCDADNKAMSMMRGYLKANGINGIQFIVNENVTTGGTNASLGLEIKSDGGAYAYVPTPANTAKGNEIITAEWAESNLTPKVVNTPVNNTDAANKSYVDNQISPRAVPTGCILPFMGTTVPNGFLLCNGATVSRTTYANLFKAIGTKFGTGDGSTTFTLPNGNGRYMRGTTGKPGTAVAAGLPDIQGYISTNGDSADGVYVHSGALYPTNVKINKQLSRPSNNMEFSRIGLDASRSSSYYGASSTVTPLSYSAQYLIKY